MLTSFQKARFPNSRDLLDGDGPRRAVQLGGGPARGPRRVLRGRREGPRRLEPQGPGQRRDILLQGALGRSSLYGLCW